MRGAWRKWVNLGEGCRSGRVLCFQPPDGSSVWEEGMWVTFSTSQSFAVGVSASERGQIGAAFNQLFCDGEVVRSTGKLVTTQSWKEYSAVIKPGRWETLARPGKGSTRSCLCSWGQCEEVPQGLQEQAAFQPCGKGGWYLCVEHVTNGWTADAQLPWNWQHELIKTWMENKC